MTTKKEKKSAKKTKVLKGSKAADKIAKGKVSGAKGGKVGMKKPVAGAVDKEKMAAFFSAGGMPEAVPESKPVVASAAKSGEARVVKKEKSKVSVVEDAAEMKDMVLTEESDSDAVNAAEDRKLETPEIKTQKNEDEKGEKLMTTKEPVKNSSSRSNSGSIGIMPMFVVLLMIAAFWMYYISATPLLKTAGAKIESGTAKISVLENKVKSLLAEIAVLKAKLSALQNSALKTPVKSSVVSVGKFTAVKKVKGSSFDKAPVPFWRDYKHPRERQLEKLQANGKSTNNVKALKSGKSVDSFSKAPVPFWRKTKTKTKPAAEVHHSSFDKAPVPFWLKK